MIVIDSRNINYFNKKIIKIELKMMSYMSYNEIYNIEKKANGKINVKISHSIDDLGFNVFLDKEEFNSYCDYLLEELKILNLKPEYRNDNIMDGYGWELKIEFEGGAKFESYGVNKKPRVISKLIKSFKEIIFLQEKIFKKI